MTEWLKSVCPPLYNSLLWIYRKTPLYTVGLNKALRERRHQEATFLKDLFDDNHIILSGPFKGLRYLDEASGSALLPKLLGTYEAALHPWIDEVLSESYNTLIDVGCAEGYYAVGLAQACPDVNVFAYDLNPNARELCRRLAELNGVKDRVEIGMECGERELGQHIREKTLIICDIEGAEFELLDPQKTPELKKCDLIIEAHDFINPDITPTLKQRFQSTHRIETVVPLTAIKCDRIAHLPKEDQEFILDEQRAPEQVWHRLLAIKNT